MKISNEWEKLCSEFHTDENLVNFYPTIKRYYSEPHRKYHNLNHIASCLNELKYANSIIQNSQEVKMAIWFHDIIYNPLRKDNEEKSAEMAKKMLSNVKVSDSSIKNIYNLILATKHHDLPKRIDEKIIVDIDLSSLGKPKEEFETNATNIRKEYRLIPNFMFNKGRRRILQNFLNREFIYSTEIFRNRYELQARQNLKSAIDKL